VVLIATAMAMLTKILADVELDPDGANTKDRDVARDLFAQLDKMLNDGREPISTTLRRLFHPNPRLRRAVTEAALPERHTHPVKGAQGAVQLISTQHDVWVRPAKRIGWLAHFNAACCYSLAIELPEGARPWICDDPTWQEDCCRAALRELTKVLRHPYSQLDTSWLWYDPDLDPLKAALLLRSEVRKADPLVQLARRIGLPLVTPLRP
jgi:hypothetical protein